jgi:predicted glycoside hydrolase/deacetylase ChbG (UPF0249 family)
VAKHLIINADDLGICESTNRAIEKAFREGVVTSASVMANMPSLEHALEHVVRPHPPLGIGFHFCLTSGRPVSPPADVPLLVDARGRFRHGFGGLLRMILSRRSEALPQIEAEFKAQLGRLDSLGVVLDHVDSHQHIHMIPPIFRMVEATASARQLAIRLSDERLPRKLGRWLGALHPIIQGGLAKKIILSHYSHVAIARGIDASYPRYYYGILETGHMDLAAIARIVRELPDGVAELNIHPGLGPELLDEVSLECSEEDRQFLARPARVRELEALLSPKTRTLLNDSGIGLVKFRDPPLMGAT